MLGEQPAGEQEGVLHVRPLNPVHHPLGGKVLEVQPAGEVGEADQVEVVLRVLALDERVERQRHPLGGHPVPPQRHREGQVDQQGGGGPGTRLRLDQLEVVRLAA